MKILQIIRQFSPSSGGEYNVCYNLSKHLCEMGHEVTILTTDMYSDTNITCFSPNVQIISFHCRINIAGFVYAPSMKKWLSKNVRMYDVIHIHSYRGYHVKLASKYAVKYGIPYIIQPHGSYSRIVEKQGMKKLFDIVWGNNILEGAQKIIAVSKYEQKSFLEGGIISGKIQLIYNGLPVDRFSTDVSCGSVVSEDESADKTILYLGRLHQRKGPEFLIRAFHELSLRNPSIKLHIVGTGDKTYARDLINLCHDLGLGNKVVFLGFIDDEKKEYAQADVLVYPSYSEIFGLVPFEAILCGTPVIVTDDCGCGEIIQQMDAGYLVHYDDVKGLADQIEYVLSHPVESSQKVQRGKEYIMAHLSWEIIAKEFEMIY